jgi:ribose/xylose/arabinose/galactoside ABC-type transport system permease subunit
MHINKRQKIAVAVMDNLIWIIVAVSLVIFSLLSERFFTVFNFVSILPRVAALALLVIGQSFVMLTGNFDLSAESTLGLTAMVGALLVAPAASGGAGIMMNPAIAILVMITIGASIGLFNGLMITKMRMNNLLVTIAMLILLRGVVLVVSPGRSVGQLGEVFSWIGSGFLFRIPAEGRVIGVSASLFFVLLMFFIAHVTTRYTQFGRNLYGIGSSLEAAESSGIKTDRVVIFAYIISGVCAALAGLIAAGRANAVQGSFGSGWIFQVQAAAVVGGISLAGGRGSMIGALGGVLFWGILESGLSIMQASPYTINIFRGSVLLLALLLDTLKNEYLRNVLLRQALMNSKIGIADRHF